MLTTAVIAGVVLTAYLGSFVYDLGADLTMDIITAVVLGVFHQVVKAPLLVRTCFVVCVLAFPALPLCFKSKPTVSGYFLLVSCWLLSSLLRSAASGTNISTF